MDYVQNTDQNRTTKHHDQNVTEVNSLDVDYVQAGEAVLFRSNKASSNVEIRIKNEQEVTKTEMQKVV